MEPTNKHSASTSLDDLLAQIRATTNPVTKSVLRDCIVDRLYRMELA